MTERTVRSPQDLEELTRQRSRAWAAWRRPRWPTPSSAVARRDIALARAVVERDAKVDAMHRDIEKKAIRSDRPASTCGFGPAQDPGGDEAVGRSGADRQTWPRISPSGRLSLAETEPMQP